MNLPLGSQIIMKSIYIKASYTATIIYYTNRIADLQLESCLLSYQLEHSAQVPMW